MAANKDIKITLKAKAGASVKSAFGSVKSGLADIGSAAGSALNLGKYVVAGGAAAGAALVGLSVRAAAAGDKVDKLSQRLGVSEKFTAGLAHAANLGGTEIGAMETGIRRLGKSAYDASQGSKTAQVAFAALGVETRDASGQFKTTEQLFMETSDALSKVENNTEKAALAQVIFGKSGTALLPMLRGGAKGMRAAMEESEALGNVWNKETTKAAADLWDNFSRVSFITDNLANGIGARLFPVMMDVTNGMIDWFKANRDWIDSGIDKAVDLLGDGVAWVKDQAVAAYAQFQTWSADGTFADWLETGKDMLTGLGEAYAFIKPYALAFYEGLKFTGIVIGELITSAGNWAGLVIGTFTNLGSFIMQIGKASVDPLIQSFSVLWETIKVGAGWAMEALEPIMSGLYATDVISDKQFIGFHQAKKKLQDTSALEGAAEKQRAVNRDGWAAVKSAGNGLYNDMASSGTAYYKNQKAVFSRIGGAAQNAADSGNLDVFKNEKVLRTVQAGSKAGGEALTVAKERGAQFGSEVAKETAKALGNFEQKVRQGILELSKQQDLSTSLTYGI